MDQSTDLIRNDVPRRIDQARVTIRSFREQLGLAGGGVTVAGVAGHAAGLPEAMPLTAIGLAGLALLYFFPVTNRARRARAILSEWETLQVAPLVGEASAADERISAAEAMVERIGAYVGAERQSAVAAKSLLAVLYDSLEDLAAIGLLRSVDSRVSEGRPTLTAKADELSAQINDRMSRAVELIADLYGAVLAHDAIALQEVLKSAEGELVRLRAEEEVETMLDGFRTERLE